MIIFNVITLFVVFSLFCVVITLCLCLNSSNWRDEDSDYELDEFLQKKSVSSDTNINR